MNNLVRALADLPITRKPIEVRMGREKGNPTDWIARVSTRPFEMNGVSFSNTLAKIIEFLRNMLRLQ